MRNVYNDDDLQDTAGSGSGDREISLGTSTVIGIFFALALICALFFGFGYTVGRRSAQSVVSANTTMLPLPVQTSGAKPSPNGVVARLGRRPESETSSTPESATSARANDSEANRQAAAGMKGPSSPRAPSADVAPAGSSWIVQVAAVSHPEDANVLLSALKQKGYGVSVRQVPQDKLLHVQVGPFSVRKDADAMRQRLLADGYNAIIK